MRILEEWIASYNPKSQEDLFNAKREIVQEVVLNALGQTDFYESACFYGGTALRIFYGLDRFSEDLDFSLLHADPNFTLSKYFDKIIIAFDALGLEADISIKKKTSASAVESAFLKENSEWTFLNIVDHNVTGLPKKIKVKFEVDRDPPLSFQTEQKLLIRPYTTYVPCMTIDNLFAGKVHALLFRKWVNNEKGRDWYDFIWYVSRKTPINLVHLSARAIASQNLESGQQYNIELLKELLHERINLMKLDLAKRDISRFIKDQSVLDIWSKSFFHDVVDLMPSPPGGHPEGGINF